MASIDRRQDGHYRARWREYPGAPQKTKQFRRKKDAELFLDAIRGDLAHGRYVDPAGSLTVFRDYAEQWRAGQVHRPSTVPRLRATSASMPTPSSVTARSGASDAVRSRRG